MRPYPSHETVCSGSLRLFPNAPLLWSPNHLAQPGPEKRAGSGCRGRRGTIITTAVALEGRFKPFLGGGHLKVVVSRYNVITPQHTETNEFTCYASFKVTRWNLEPLNTVPPVNLTTNSISWHRSRTSSCLKKQPVRVKSTSPFVTGSSVCLPFVFSQRNTWMLQSSFKANLDAVSVRPSQHHVKK